MNHHRRIFQTFFTLILAALLLAVWRASAHSGPATPSDPMPEPLIAPETLPGRPEAVNGGPSYADQVMELVNQERWNNGGRPPLKRSELLDLSAMTHSINMAERDFFAHCDLDTGASPWQRMQAVGYSYNSAGENIAAGYGSPASVMNGWMNSSGHRANILSTSYRELGIGYSYQNGDQGNVRFDNNGDCTADDFNNGPYFSYWTQNFGRRNSVYPVIINREAYETSSATVDLYVYGEGWAQEMRFCNSGGTWSAWQPYAPNASWTMTGGSGVRYVMAEIRNGGTTYTAYDSIVLNGAGPLSLEGASNYAYLPHMARSTIGVPTCSD